MRQLRRCSKLVSLALPTPEEAEPERAIRAALEHLGMLARLWARAREGEERREVEGWMRAAAEHLANWPSPAWTVLHRALPKPNRTLALRPFLADYYRARLARALLEEERAPALSMRGVALSALGRREEALAAAQEAAELYRWLAAQQPDAFLPGLAMSLTNLGITLSALGRRRPWQQHRKPLSSTAGWPPNSPTPSSLTWQIA
jgi:tetratricopeptide (TPR) repeat protein